MTTEPFFIEVVTATSDPDAPPYDQRRINYHSDPARKWLAKHSYWALTNGYSVHTKASATQ